MAPPNAPPPVIDHTPIPGVSRIIAVGAGKGGVGKSTVSVLLAHAFTAQGMRVGLCDTDIHGPSLPRMLGLPLLQPELRDGKMLPPISHGIRLNSIGLIAGEQAAILRGPMVTKSLRQLLRWTAWDVGGPLDVLILDMAPGTGDTTLSLLQSAPVDAAILVTTPQEIAVMDARKAGEMFVRTGAKLAGVIENMSGFTDSAGVLHRLFGAGGGASLAASFGVPLLAQLPLDPTLGAALDQGKAPDAENPVMGGLKAILGSLR